MAPLAQNGEDVTFGREEEALAVAVQHVLGVEELRRKARTLQNSFNGFLQNIRYMNPVYYMCLRYFIKQVCLESVEAIKMSNAENLL